MERVQVAHRRSPPETVQPRNATDTTVRTTLRYDPKRRVHAHPAEVPQTQLHALVTAPPQGTRPPRRRRLQCLQAGQEPRPAGGDSPATKRRSTLAAGMRC